MCLVPDFALHQHPDGCHPHPVPHLPVPGPIHPQQDEVDIGHVGQVEGQHPEVNQRYSELKELYCFSVVFSLMDLSHLSFKNILTKPFLHHYS